MNNITQRLMLLAQIFRFGVVGVAASCVHFSLVYLLVERYAFLPLVANVFGYFCGFQVSYWGHKSWTFKGNRTAHHVALPKLAVVQSINFIANQSLFYIFLSLHLPYLVALFLVLAILPVFTFITSKLWVFR